MSAYVTSFSIRYELPPIQKKVEVATMTAAIDVLNEGDAAPDHEKRMQWATWANSNSGAAMMPFMWPVAMNPAVESAVESDPTGNSVLDSDVQFIVNANLNAVIAGWVPPA
jgi:hypothetical protein